MSNKIDYFVKNPSAVRQAHSPEQSRRAALCFGLRCLATTPAAKPELKTFNRDSERLYNRIYLYNIIFYRKILFLCLTFIRYLDII
jgi:hypothetical protein